MYLPQLHNFLQKIQSEKIKNKKLAFYIKRYLKNKIISLILFVIFDTHIILTE